MAKMKANSFSKPVGIKLHHLRRLKGLRLKDLAAQVGCTASMLSKIENAKVAPSFELMNVIIKALGANLAYLFAEEEAATTPILPQGSRPVIVFDQIGRSKGVHMERLIPYSENHLLQANIHIVAPDGGRTIAISHTGEEVGYILEGEIELSIEKKNYRVKAGDAFHFLSEKPHKYRNIGTTVARILWVNTPPAYSIQPVKLVSEKSALKRTK